MNRSAAATMAILLGLAAAVGVAARGPRGGGGGRAAAGAGVGARPSGNVAPAARPSPSGAARPVTIDRARVNSVVQDRGAIVRDGRFANDARQITANDSRRQHYYWHTYNGHRFSHYTDARGASWYGFYAGAGAAFYWTRYHAGYWWYHDPANSAWVFYNNGYWWYPQPTGGMYVYYDDGYYPYDPEKVKSEEPAKAEPPEGTPPEEPPADSDAEKK